MNVRISSKEEIKKDRKTILREEKLKERREKQKRRTRN